MHTANVESESLLTPAEVASLFRVDPKTVTRWSRSGKLSAVRTLGGHRRYRESEVMHLLNGVPVQRDTPVQRDVPVQRDITAQHDVTMQHDEPARTA